MTVDTIGRTTWAIPGGRMPLRGTGPEPAFTSHDSLCLLNAGEEMANVEVTIVYTDREPVAPYRLTIAPRRVRPIRINDLIFPEAIPLETAYAATVQSDVPLVVQFTRQDTGHAARTIAGAMAFPDDAAPLPRGTTTGGTTMPAPIGRKRWAIAEGYIPGWSHGPEPELTSHETVCILNAGDQDAHVAITVFFADREPAGPYRLTVAARRTHHVRFNDLTDPEPVPTATPFASVIAAEVPIVVQHTRLDSRQAENALLSTIAFPADG
jgi:hypothetical protein